MIWSELLIFRMSYVDIIRLLKDVTLFDCLRRLQGLPSGRHQVSEQVSLMWLPGQERDHRIPYHSSPTRPHTLYIKVPAAGLCHKQYNSFRI